MFKVILRSKDGHVFEFSTKAKTIEEAKKNAMQRVNDNHWEHYQYKIEEVIKL